MYDPAHERGRRKRETPERILQIAKSKGSFSVSLRYRDDWLRERCDLLKRNGKLVGGRRDGDRLVYFPSAATRKEGQQP